VSSNSKSFWSTIPGLITGLAGILTALVGLGTLLIQVGVIGGDDDGDSTVKSGVTATTRRGTATGNSQTEDSDSPATAAKPSFTVAPDDLKLTASEKTDTVTVSNTGTTALTLSTELTGDGADQFTVTKGSCGSQVPKGGSCSMTVSFKGGLSAQAELVVKAPGAPSAQEVTLEGSLL
jgi:hypothetical protein